MPITEALIDLQAELPVGVSIEKLSEFQARLGTAYPSKRNVVRMRIEFNPAASSIVNEGAQQDGFLFFSEDSGRAVQARLNGFSSSWLKPYKDWAALRDDGRPPAAPTDEPRIR